jgi:hypothetical protein
VGGGGSTGVCLLGKYSTTWAIPQLFFFSYFFR